MARRPIYEIRRSLIVARVWRKKQGTAIRHVVTVTRLFRNGTEWKQSTRFSPNDLPLVRYVLDKAHTWILQSGGPPPS